jgi:hypothetical protein
MRFYCSYLNEAQHKAIEDAGYITFDDVVSASRQDLLGVPGIGSVAYGHIRAALDTYILMRHYFEQQQTRAYREGREAGAHVAEWPRCDS